MTSQIEKRLEDALRAGAAAIAQIDAETLTSYEAPRQVDATHDAGRSSRQWLLPVAAAACVVLAAVAALAIDQRHSPAPPVKPGLPTNPAPLTTPAPVTSPRTAPSPRPTVLDGLHAASCRVPMPQKWSAVFTAGQIGSDTPTGYDAAGYPILDIDAAGDVLAAPSDSLVVVRADGSTRTVYRAPQLSAAQGAPARIVAGRLDSRWALFALSLGGGQGEVRQLGVIERATGTARVFRDLPLSNPTTMSTPVLFAGAVYWSETNPDGVGTVRRYDPATGGTTAVAHGPNAGNVTELAGGLYWENDGKLVAHQAGRLPAGFRYVLGKINTMVGDAGSYAWSGWDNSTPTPHTAVWVARSGMSAPLIADTAPADSFVSVLAMTGPYVIWTDQQNIVVLDTRTGATTTLSGGRFATARAAGGHLAVNYLGSKGGAQLEVVRAADLPELHC